MVLVWEQPGKQTGLILTLVYTIEQGFSEKADNLVTDMWWYWDSFHSTNSALRMERFSVPADLEYLGQQTMNATNPRLFPASCSVIPSVNLLSSCL
jgi:hypothetical protein